MEQRSVDDVGVADHPADVGRRPEHLARIDAVEILHRPFERDHVAAIVAHHALGAAGRARGVEHIKRVGRLDRHAVIDRARVDQRIVAHLGPVVVAAFDQLGFELRTLQDQTGVGLVGRERDRLVEQRLVGDDAAGLDAAARRQDRLRRGVVDAGREFVCGKAPEHHGMDGADAGAGQHGDRRLRHHRHVDQHPVALADAEVAQHGGEHLGLGQQAMIGEDALGPRKRRIVDDGGLVAAPGIDVAVDGVEAGVADAAGKPAAVNAGLGIEDRLRLFEPGDVLGRLRPEPFRIALPARIDLVIAARADVHWRFSPVSPLPAVRGEVGPHPCPPPLAGEGWVGDG